MHSGVPFDRYLRCRRARWATGWAGISLLVIAAAWADRIGWFGLLDAGSSDLTGRLWTVVAVEPGPVLGIVPVGETGPRRRVRLAGLSLSCDAAFGIAPGATQAEALRGAVGASPIRLQPVGAGPRSAGAVSVHAWDRDGEFLNEKFLAEGICCVAREAAHRDHGRYRLLEEQARRDGAGLWRGQVTVAEVSP